MGPRQPCPCGSGRRYKACHGSAGGPVPTYVARPFEGIAGECDLIAMREIVAAATAPLTLKDGVADGRTVQLCSLLPMAAPALSRADGSIWLGLQVQHGFGDPSRDLAAVLLKALESEPGAGVIGLTDAPGDGPRLQDLVADAPLEVTVHDGFDYWIADVEDPDGSAAASLEQANAAAEPERPARLASRRRTGPTSAPASTCAGCCRTTRSRCSTRWRGCTSPARTWSPRAPGSSGCSARTVCSCRSGTCPRAPAPRCSRSRSRGSRPSSTAALADGAPLTGRRACGAQRAGQPPAHDPLTPGEPVPGLSA